MKRYRLIFGALAASCALQSVPSVAADAESTRIGRCDIPRSTSLFSRSSNRLPSDWATKTISPSHGQSLPSVMVDGWPARKAPADLLLRELMAESGLSYEGPGALPTVDWNGQVMSMQSVVSTLVNQFGGHWTFDGRTLSVSRTAPAGTTTATVPLPKERDLRVATIDILRAYDLDVRVNQDTIELLGPLEEMRKARQALFDAKSITVLDVIFLKGRPDEGRYDWAALGSVKSKPNGAGGTFVFTDAEPESLIQRLAQRGDLVEDSSQSVAAPAGWGLAVPPSQCGVGSGEIIVTSKAVADKINLSIAGNALDANFPDFVLGSTAASVSLQPDNGWIRMVLVRPRVVTFSSR